MPIKKQLIIFARAPEYGQVKQRLARDIGHAKALRFYESTLLSLINRLRSGPWSLCVSVAEQKGLSHPAFANIDTICQPQGDLGIRMKSALQAYADSSTARIIVGSDIPTISRNHIHDAFEALETNDLVFGPATDGGFWLVGCSVNSPGLLSANDRFMQNVRWSTTSTLKDTVASLPSHHGFAFVETLSDVDDGKSYSDYVQQSGLSRST